MFLNKLKYLFYLYILCWIATAIYMNYFGTTSYRSFMYNLGYTIVWPDLWFGTKWGTAIGSFLLTSILIYIGLKKR